MYKLLPFLSLKDTLQEVSISEGELLMLDDSPIAKLLNQMRTPPNIDGHVSILARTEQNISEGEVSKGEDLVIKERSVVPLEQREANDLLLGRYLLQSVSYQKSKASLANEEFNVRAVLLEV